MAADLSLIGNPPSDMRWNLRPKERAMDRPSEVLPTPGGPTNRESAFMLGFRPTDGKVIENTVFSPFAGRSGLHRGCFRLNDINFAAA